MTALRLCLLWRLVSARVMRQRAVGLGPWVISVGCWAETCCPAIVFLIIRVRLAILGHAARRSPSTPSRARLTAAASREKSAATLVRAANAGAAAAVAAPHQVGDLAFHLGSGGGVVGTPGGVGLGGAGPGQLLLVGADRDDAAGGRGGALRGQRAIGAGGAERGDTAAALDGADRHAHLPGAGDGCRRPGRW